MRSIQISCLLFLVIVLANTVSAQRVVYVSPTGSDTSAGTLDQPFKTISKGLSTIGTNGTLILRGGVYLLGSSKLSLSKTGQAGNPIRIWAYVGEAPILDCTGNTSDGLSISGSYYHLKGLEVTKAGHNGINISGNNNIIENCVVHDNQNTGLHLTGSVAPGPSNNLILNCDSFRNYDSLTYGGNADGFSAKWTVGPGNVFRGCRAYNNSDDGWDLWMGTSTVLIDSCVAFRNGVDSWHSGRFDGNGNGFKLGGSNVATPHIVRNCVSFDNAGNTGRGFDENNNLAGQTLYNCTAYRNKGDNYHFQNTVVSGSHVIKNCISYVGIVSISSGTLQKNSWQGFTVSAADFVSLDTTGVTAPRDSVGHLQPSTFLHLASGSSLIDAGVDVGLPYRSSAPDLGAFETGVLTGVSEKEIAPRDFTLDQNFPNPFNPNTAISYQLLADNFVKLSVCDVFGKEITTLVKGEQAAGRHTVKFDASALASGVYFARLQSGAHSKTIKLVLMK